MKYIVGIFFLSFILFACGPQDQVGQVDEDIQPEVEPKITPALSEEPPPIQRIVAFKFKEGATEAAIQQHMDYFASLKDSIPQILSYRAGETIPADYENTGDYDVMHYSTFASEEAIEEYFNHPAHQRFIEANKEIWESVIVLNSEVEE
jgi:hypothetical protein